MDLVVAEEFAVDLARKAGDLMRTNFTLGAKKVWKEDHSPLTVTDETINEMVLEAVRTRFPDHAIIGEEGSEGDTANAEWVWVCDPVDGTVPFSHGFPTFVFSLGLCQNGESVLGVLYDPFLDRLVTARKGNGAYLNGEPTKVGDFTSFEHTIVEVEGPNRFHDFGSVRTWLHDQGSRAFTLNSCLYAGVLLAAGEIAAVVYPDVHPWDGCALDIIVQEAGGKMTSLRGEPNMYNGDIDGFVASNGILHDDLLAVIGRELS